jgi:hypothetical protein
VDYDRAHPQSPFVPQGGPTYTIYRARLEPSRAANLTFQDVINVLIDNRIPPAWIDHSYPYGVIALNNYYTGAPLVQGALDSIDNERIARLHLYGEPPAIPAWDGLRNPTPEEVQGLHDIMNQEDLRYMRRTTRDAAEAPRGLASPAWLLAGQTGVVEYLLHRPQGTATQYALTHPFIPPRFAELDNAGAPTADTPMAPTGGNPPEGPATMDVDVAANADIVTSSDNVSGGPVTTLDPPVLEGPDQAMAQPTDRPLSA